MKRRRGFAMVSAIFILVVLAALGGFVVSLSSGQQVGAALDLQGVRAYQTARAGLEWGLYRQLRAGSCAGATSFAPAASSLAGFTVTVDCVATADPGGFSGPTVYTVTATACNQPNAAEPLCPNITTPGDLYVERRLSVSF
ncbi:MAG: agglutinin biogenesis protein MshP [Rhodocyclales bacterium]|nr:agglutinin biogenesis protein MshP [Rhodocyclales bacterium]